MFKEIGISVLIFFVVTLCISVYAHAIPEYFAMVTRLLEYVKLNSHLIGEFFWGLGFEFVSAVQEWVVKITINVLGG